MDKRIGTTRRQGHHQTAPVDSLREKLVSEALELRESHSPHIKITLSTDEALRLGPEHVLYFIDTYLAKYKVNDRENFVVMNINNLRNKDKILSALAGNNVNELGSQLGSLNVYDRNQYWHRHDSSSLEIEVCPSCRKDKIFIKIDHGSPSNYPLVNTYEAEPRKNEVMYAGLWHLRGVKQFFTY